MDPIEPRPGFGAYPLRVVARLALLGAVIVAVFALHVLTAEGDHIAPAASPSGTVSAQYQGDAPIVSGITSRIDQEAVAAAGVLLLAPIAVGQPDDTSGLGLLVDCVLFLVIFGSAAMLVRRRDETEVAPAGPGVWDRFTRIHPAGPGVPRLALCVIRV